MEQQGHQQRECYAGMNNTCSLEVGINKKDSSVKKSTGKAMATSRYSQQELELARAWVMKIEEKVSGIEGETNDGKKKNMDCKMDTSRQESRIKYFLRVKEVLDGMNNGPVKKQYQGTNTIRELSQLKPMIIKVIKLKAIIEYKDKELREMRQINKEKENVKMQRDRDVGEQLRLKVNILEDSLTKMVDELEVERANVELKGLELDQSSAHKQELWDMFLVSKECTEKERNRNNVLNQQLKLKCEEELKFKKELSRANVKIQELDSSLVKTNLKVQLQENKLLEKVKKKTKEVEDMNKMLSNAESRIKQLELKISDTQKSSLLKRKRKGAGGETRKTPKFLKKDLVASLNFDAAPSSPGALTAPALSFQEKLSLAFSPLSSAVPRLPLSSAPTSPSSLPLSVSTASCSLVPHKIQTYKVPNGPIRVTPETIQKFKKKPPVRIKRKAENQREERRRKVNEERAVQAVQEQNQESGKKDPVVFMHRLGLVSHSEALADIKEVEEGREKRSGRMTRSQFKRCYKQGGSRQNY